MDHTSGGVTDSHTMTTPIALTCRRRHVIPDSAMSFPDARTAMGYAVFSRGESHIQNRSALSPFYRAHPDSSGAEERYYARSHMTSPPDIMIGDTRSRSRAVVRGLV
jgi:hypothetical protein